MLRVTVTLVEARGRLHAWTELPPPGSTLCISPYAALLVMESRKIGNFNVLVDHGRRE